MPYIPDDAAWFLAELVEQISVQGDRRQVVHINTVLVSASTPTEAYESALALGRDAEIEYGNPQGALVTVRFRGIKTLDVIHDKLEHGAELCYSQLICSSDAEVSDLVPVKAKLNVFAEPQNDTAPDYSAKDVVADVDKLTHLARKGDV